MTAPIPNLAHAARIGRAIAQWRVSQGLTANQADALLQTWDAGALSAADLSRRIGITTASMSRLLAGLERDEWIVRAPDPYDARRSYVQAGRRLSIAIERLLMLLDLADSIGASGDIDGELGSSFATG
jgi:DNA-binding MarR family transcriptional regulator